MAIKRSIAFLAVFGTPFDDANYFMIKEPLRSIIKFGSNSLDISLDDHKELGILIFVNAFVTQGIFEIINV